MLLIQEQLLLMPTGQPIVFTDGSALSNMGPCRASVICYVVYLLEGAEGACQQIQHLISQGDQSFAISHTFHPKLPFFLLIYICFTKQASPSLLEVAVF